MLRTTRAGWTIMLLHIAFRRSRSSLVFLSVASSRSSTEGPAVDGQSLQQQGILADEMGLGKTIFSNLAAHIPHQSQETTRALSYHPATVNDDELVRRICKVGADSEDERATPHNVATSKANCRWLKWVHIIIESAV
ncbi:uncharacterized protein F5891DRAFT_246101 [Suillus fuscotomentosus]|uniref:SNF2 N-terminal domain-containing protein n=1 Tax=Suillus fuscotomentosus TaxID=1912939 RepID=A0AAD4HC84_9AGAM|nr:uncharacterized protein F5891DRAFT_246101 [Suillus fuscotomentosus]KAG1887424.1 hypothetical protein F5891DRAFT_246101 [Suillus fuscotomentosus]